jgi:hypothetical protein
MSGLVGVRSARALGPQALSQAIPVHASCVPPPHHRPSRLPARTSPPRIACPPFDSAVRVGLQQAAELRHLQRHRHERHVLRALCACPWPPSLESGPERACRRCRLVPSLPPPGTHLAPHYMHAPLSTPAGRKLLVRPQQAAHPLRVGGHRGLRLRWLWLGLGSGKLRVREARLESCSGSSLYTFENHNNIHFGQVSLVAAGISATAFVAFELYDARFLRALQSERVRCVDVLR